MAQEQEQLRADFLDQSLALFDAPNGPPRVVTDAVPAPIIGDFGIPTITATFNRLAREGTINENLLQEILPRAVAASVGAKTRTPQKNLRFSRVQDPMENLRPNNFYFNINGNILREMTRPADGEVIPADQYIIDEYPFSSIHEELTQKKLYYEYNFRRVSAIHIEGPRAGVAEQQFVAAVEAAEGPPPVAAQPEIPFIEAVPARTQPTVDAEQAAKSAKLTVINDAIAALDIRRGNMLKEEEIVRRTQDDWLNTQNIPTSLTSKFVEPPSLGDEPIVDAEVLARLNKLTNSRPFHQDSSSRMLQYYLQAARSVINGKLSMDAAYLILEHIFTGQIRETVHYARLQKTDLPKLWLKLQLLFGADQNNETVLLKIRNLIAQRPSCLYRTFAALENLINQKNSHLEDPQERQSICHHDVRTSYFAVLRKWYNTFYSLVLQRYTAVVTQASRRGLPTENPAYILLVICKGLIKKAPPSNSPTNLSVQINALDTYDAAPLEEDDLYADEAANGYPEASGLNNADVAEFSGRPQRRFDARPQNPNALGRPAYQGQGQRPGQGQFQGQYPGQEQRQGQGQFQGDGRGKIPFKIPPAMNNRCLLCGSNLHRFKNCDKYGRNVGLTERGCKYCGFFHNSECRLLGHSTSVHEVANGESSRQGHQENMHNEYEQSIQVNYEGQQ